MGGDCLNFGCVPSKALLAAAHTANAVRGARRFGSHVANPISTGTSSEPMCSRSSPPLRRTTSEARFTGLGVTVLRGEARFTGPNSVSVDGRVITAKQFVIAAAAARWCHRSRPRRGSALDQRRAVRPSQKPTHLLVLGGGPIGLEMADAFASLGCAVTVIESATIANRDDAELVAGLRLALTRRGVTILEGVPVTSAEPGPTLVLQDGKRIAGSHLLVAVGRQPNVEALNLEAAGIGASRLGIVTDHGLRCRATEHSTPLATSRIRKASARERSPMSACITPALSYVAHCFACRRSSTTPPCLMSPTPIPNSHRPA